MIKKNDKIFLAGHNGLVGSAILRKLKKKKFKNIITVSRHKLDLLDQQKTLNFLKKKKPKFVFICPAKVGGIFANNKFRAEFIYENLQIQNNLIHGSYLAGVKKLIFLGSSCIYPKNSKQPIKEEYLLTSSLEKTNEPYAIAKIAGLKMCESYNSQFNTNYLCLMPANVYGPNDNFDLLNSHFIPALIAKIHKLKKKRKKILNIWGTGKVKREVIYVDDLADACVYFMNKKVSENLINIGSGKDFTIETYAKKFLKILKEKAKLKFDKTKPDGVRQKIVDIKIAKKYGWLPKTSLEEGVLKTYSGYLKSINEA